MSPENPTTDEFEEALPAHTEPKNLFIDHETERKDNTKTNPLENRAKEIQVQLTETFEHILLEAVKNGNIPCKKKEVSIQSNPRLRSQLMSFEGGPDISADFEIAANIWEEGNEEGQPALSLERSVFFDNKSKEWKVYRSQIIIPEKFQGRGMGSLALIAEEEAYKAANISEVLLTAGEPIGIYNNAREGFDFVDPDVRKKANASLFSLVLKAQQKEKITSLRYKEEEKNLWPLDREYSAHELSQMKAYNERGEEILWNARRLKNWHETREVTKRLAQQCLSETPQPHENIMRNLGRLINTDTITQLKRADHPRETLDTLIDRSFLKGKAKKVTQTDHFKETFVNFVTTLDWDEISTQQSYSLGKAFFLDVSRKEYLPSWLGKKRLKKQTS